MFKYYLALFGLLLIAGTLFFWNAHRQVSSVAPPLPDAETLLSYRSEEGPARVFVHTVSDQPFDGGSISHNVVLISWEDGRQFMLDAGMGARQAAAFGELLNKMGGTGEPAAFYGGMQDRLGADLQRVAGVGFTHLHIDHTQGLQAFCEALDQRPRGVQTRHQNSMHNFNTSHGAQIVATSCLELETVPGDRLSPINGFPGLAAFSLGGHTPGSTLWVVALNEIVLLFTGDITNSKRALDEDLEKEWLYSTVLVPEDTDRTANIRNWLRTLEATGAFSVVIAHDISSYDQRWIERL